MQRIKLAITRWTEPGEHRPTHIAPAVAGDQPDHHAGWQTDLVEVEVPEEWSVGETGAGEVALFDDRNRYLRLRLNRQGNAVIVDRHIPGEDSGSDFADQVMSLPILTPTA